MTVVTPATIGGRFTNALPWSGVPVVSTQDGGRHRQGGLVGSGSAVNPGSVANNGSSSGVNGSWTQMFCTQGLNELTWSSYLPTNAPPWYYFKSDYAVGSQEPHPGVSSYFTGEAFGAPQWPSNASYPGYFAYQDNPFAGANSGPDGTGLRDPGNWIATIVQPPSQINPNTGQHYVLDTGSVKTSVANQYDFTPLNVGQPISGFKSIKSYRDKINPHGTGYNYDASWDVYGWAHTAPTQYSITLECMFWTYWNGTQAPWNIQNRTHSPYESGLDFGDGNIWDLYMTDDTAATGGVTNSYSYGIYVLSDISPNTNHDIGWIDILTPLKYFVKHYVVTSNGAPADPLDCPIWSIISGWEMCSSNYAPAQFTHSDYRLEMT